MSFKQFSRAILTTTLVFTSSASVALEEGDIIPEFDIASIYEARPNIKLENLEGKTLFIDFWASWCAPCITSLPLYDELYDKFILKEGRVGKVDEAHILASISVICLSNHLSYSAL